MISDSIFFHINHKGGSTFLALECVFSVECDCMLEDAQVLRVKTGSAVLSSAECSAGQSPVPFIAKKYLYQGK